MPKNLDTRDFTYSAAADDFAAAAAKVSTVLPGSHEVSPGRINPFTGSVEALQSANAVSGFRSAAGLGPSDEDLLDSAIKHVYTVAAALGFGPTQRPEFVPDPYIKRTSTGERVVNLRQQYMGVPVFQMERAVVFDQDGAIQNVSGTSVGLPSNLSTLPTVPVENAALSAAKYITTPGSSLDAWTKQQVPDPVIDVTNYQPRVLARIPLPSQPLVLEQDVFGEAIPAHLVFFYQGQTTRLGWHMLISTPNLESQYVVIVEADAASEAEIKDPKVLYCRETSSSMSAEPEFRGNVWTHNPSVNPRRQLVEFPRPLADYPLSPTNLPEDFPFSWIESGSDQAIGNNAIALLGNTSNSVRGARANGTTTFDPAQDQGDEQKVVNIFYFCNFMHDFFFMLGFDEPSGNLQQRNFSGLGRGGDPVVARAHPGGVRGTANMLTLADGIRAQMNMGLVVGSNRHTAFDSDVVFHEYTHGVTKRLVGGMLDAQGLQGPQSEGMGEGWSDYFALTIQNYGLQQERTILGDWVLNDAGGIRLHPYDDNYPATYGDVGRPPYTEEHNIGEIWCAALMKMNRDLGRAFNDRMRGHQLGWRLVLDGLKLTHADPSFLMARDAILQALDSQRRSGNLSLDDFRLARRAVWGAFARFGMGPNARSVGASLVGIVEDRSLPPGL